jgi:hypothetical protein
MSTQTTRREGPQLLPLFIQLDRIDSATLFISSSIRPSFQNLCIIIIAITITVLYQAALPSTICDGYALD